MGGIITDLKMGLAFCTRLPVSLEDGRDGEGNLAEGGLAEGSLAEESLAEGRLADAAWSLPIAGIVVGAVGGLIYWIAASLGLPTFVAATLAIGATAVLTGCLHEDGLADTADGFGAGHTKARTLEIMRDSRIGTYGVAALILSFLLRIGALASLPSAGLAVLALIGAHGAARAALPFFMRALPPAREDGLSAGAGAPAARGVAIAALLGLLVLLLCLGLVASLWAIAFMGMALAIIARIARKEIGGQTGDVLGTMEQAGEIIVLLTAAALW